MPGLVQAPPAASPRPAQRAAARLTVWAVSLSLLPGCDSLPMGYVPLKDLLREPARFAGQDIRVRGTVMGVGQMPFVDLQFFELEQEGARITVLAQRSLPRSGEHVAMVGQVASSHHAQQAVGVDWQLVELKRLTPLY